MKKFSMFEYALKITDASRLEDMGHISNISRRDFDERTTFKFSSQVPCLEYVSLLIENAILLRTNRAGRIYAAFQKLSRMKPIVDRYLRIADVSERVYVFGEADWKPPRHPHMQSMPVPADSQLAREWFVIVNSSTLRVALVALDQEGFTARTVPEERTFLAFKSSDEAVVTHLAAAAENLIDTSLAA